MAEVQTSTYSGELSQRFIEFVMMQAQQASLFLGRIPNPQTGKADVLLEPAKLFIDQLEMIREKTRGNLRSNYNTPPTSWQWDASRFSLSSSPVAFRDAPPLAGPAEPGANPKGWNNRAHT